MGGWGDLGTKRTYEENWVFPEVRVGGWDKGDLCTEQAGKDPLIRERVGKDDMRDPLRILTGGRPVTLTFVVLVFGVPRYRAFNLSSSSSLGSHEVKESRLAHPAPDDIWSLKYANHLALAPSHFSQLHNSKRGKRNTTSTPPNHPLNHGILLPALTRPFLLITPLLRDMLIVPDGPLRYIPLRHIMQPLGAHFRGQGVPRARDDVAGGCVIAGGLETNKNHQRLEKEYVWGGGGGGGERTREISPALSAAPAMSGAPRSDWSVIWWGFGTEGMVRGLAALGSTCVPSTAMSVREPPCGLGSDMFVMVCMCGALYLGECGCGRWGCVWSNWEDGVL